LFQLTRNLFWRPLASQFIRSDGAQVGIVIKLTGLWPFGFHPGASVGCYGTVIRQSAIGLISRETVEGALLRVLAIALKDKLAEIPRDISSRSCNDKSLVERLGANGLIPPVFCK
jgi:hypothetical protein